MTLEIDVQWMDPPSDEIARGPDASTWARVRVRIDDVPLTRHRSLEVGLEGSEAVDWIEGSVAGLVDWVVEAWSALLWEVRTPFSREAGPRADGAPFPGLRDACALWTKMQVESLDAVARWQHRHTLGHASSDLALPSIVMSPEMRHVILAVDHLPVELNPSIRFEPVAGSPWPHTHVLRKEDVVDSLQRLVESTLGVAAARGSARWASWMRERWDEAQRLAGDSREHDRLLVGEWMQERWAEVRERFPDSDEAVREVLVDSALVRDAGAYEAVMSALEEAPSRERHASFAPTKRLPTAPPYEQGYAAAREVREHLGLGARPVAELREVVGRMDVGVRSIDDDLPFRTAVFARAGAEPTILVNQREPRVQGVAGWRFAVAAALGRLILRPQASKRRAIGAAHGPWARWLETARANAFAVELLLPSAALDAHQGSTLGELCEEFGVSADAARWHLHNDRRNRRARVEDRVAG